LAKIFREIFHHNNKEIIKMEAREGLTESETGRLPETPSATIG
jgi:hypothetical protein